VPEAATVPGIPDAAPTESFSVPVDELPWHVPSSMDGNRRWAKASVRPRWDGHAAGVAGIGRSSVTPCVAASRFSRSKPSAARTGPLRRGRSAASCFCWRRSSHETAELKAEGARVRPAGSTAPETRVALFDLQQRTRAPSAFTRHVSLRMTFSKQEQEAADLLVGAGPVLAAEA